jgi:hypothetical protein
MAAELTLLVTLLLVIAGMASAMGYLRQRRRAGELALHLRASAARFDELMRIASQRDKLEQIQSLAESAVDGGTATVRAVHRGVAAIPFTILEAIPVTRPGTRLVRGVHDFTSDTVYDSIRVINRIVGHGLRSAMGSERRKPADKG